MPNPYLLTRVWWKRFLVVNPVTGALLYLVVLLWIDQKFVQNNETPNSLLQSHLLVLVTWYL